MDPALRCRNLHGISHDEDEHPQGDALSSSKPVRRAMFECWLDICLAKSKRRQGKKRKRDGVGLLRAGQRAKEAANAEERDQKRLDGRRAISEEPMDKVVENNGARDLTNVVAEKEAADRRDDGEEKGIDATVGPFDLD